MYNAVATNCDSVCIHIYEIEPCVTLLYVVNAHSTLKKEPKIMREKCYMYIMPLLMILTIRSKQRAIHWA